MLMRASQHPSKRRRTLAGLGICLLAAGTCAFIFSGSIGVFARRLVRHVRVYSPGGGASCRGSGCSAPKSNSAFCPPAHVCGSRSRCSGRACGRRRIVSEADVSRGQAVCVRLCDGFFFPVGDINGHSDLNGQESLCTSLCPDAPTRVFVMRNDSDKIEDGISRDGHPYSALPVAFRYTKETDNTCTCRRNKDAQSTLAALMSDVTLQRGDAVMTPSGIAVFGGGNHLPHRSSDFVALAKAGSVLNQRDMAVLLGQKSTDLIEGELADASQPSVSVLAGSALRSGSVPPRRKRASP